MASSESNPSNVLSASSAPSAAPELKQTGGGDAPPKGDAPAPSGGSGGDNSETTEGSTAPRAWPTSLPPLPPHMAGADLPIANISRIMKRSLPENGKIAKNAKECMQECVSELISFVTSEASDRCGSEKRKTINGDDILYSLRVLGFDNYEQVLKVYLSRYRQAQEENPRQRRRRASKRRSSPSSSRDTPADGDGGSHDAHGDDDDDDDDAYGDDGGDGDDDA